MALIREVIDGAKTLVHEFYSICFGGLVIQ
jgi:hypothetical protein